MSDRERIRRRDLPHWDVPGVAYFVTACLEGSIPAQGMLDINRYRTELKGRSRPAERTESQWTVDQWKLAFVRLESWLDGEPAVRHFDDPALAQIIVDSPYHFAADRYDLLGFVVMPSHYHVAFQPRDEWIATLPPETKRSPRERILQSIHRYTASRCNRVLGRTGRQFWQHECYDHWIRDSGELERILRYIEGNPERARLHANHCAWSSCSAHDRVKLGLQFGEPLRR
jgi:putative transposase